MEEAVARREKLRALREAAELSGKGADGAAGPAHAENAASTGTGEARNGDPVSNGAPQDKENEEADTDEPPVMFRNYLPRDQELHGARIPPPARPRFEDPVAPNPSDAEKTEDPLTSIAPRKPDWDLRRDVAQRLAKLDRRTQRAMVELMHEEEKRRQEEAQGEEEEGDDDGDATDAGNGVEHSG